MPERRHLMLVAPPPTDDGARVRSRGGAARSIDRDPARSRLKAAPISAALNDPDAQTSRGGADPAVLQIARTRLAEDHTPFTATRAGSAVQIKTSGKNSPNIA
jgi:hypothetical protein